MAFENNQQDQFNMNNGIDQVKQFQAELDKATAAIGAAELAAEEEQLDIKLKNLSRLQQAKLAQLSQLLALEEKGIQELAKLKLSLSNRQFAVRKKEIQKELQLYKAAAEELFKVNNKFSKPVAPKKTSSAADELKTSAKKQPADIAIQKANRKVQVDAFAVDKTRQEITDVISALQSATNEAVSTSQKEIKSSAAQPQAPVVTTNRAEPTAEVKATAQEERQFSDNHGDIERVDLGKEFPKVYAKFEKLRSDIEKQSTGTLAELNKAMADGGKNTPQVSIDLADDLLDSFEKAEEAARKIKEFNENRALNERLMQLDEEQKLRKAHEDAAFSSISTKITALAKKQDLLLNESIYAEEARQKLLVEHANRENEASLANIAAIAKANDLEHNRETYRQEAEMALSIAYKEEQNRLVEEEIAAEAKLEFEKNNEARLRDQAAHKSRIEQIEAEREMLKAITAAQTKAEDIKNNRAKYLEIAAQKLRVGHANKENELRLAGIDAEAKANDLKNNKETYELEARLARENAFYEKRNELEEERIAVETELAWDRAHMDEVMAQELQGKRLGYLKEYQEYQKKAGKYAIDQEEFEKNRAKQDRDASRKGAADGIANALTTNPLSGAHIDLQAIKKSYTEYMGQRTAELEDSGMSEASAKLTAQFELLADVSGNLAQQLNAQTDKIGAKQAPIDTRLQGSKANDTILGSYWKQLARDMNKIGAVNPYFKQEDFASNIEALVNKGISFDIKQRAFLMTIQEKIANTFDVADGTLLRLVRIQQQDTTAGRLGMESALNSFLNSMYETSEYLTDVASSVRSSLGEMQALMEGAAASELEFQVQKWMGSLYSVGMSQDAVQSIAQTFGQIASGDVNGLTGSGTGNLLIMAANEAGISIADILQDGLNADETNKLMQAMVNYLAEIAETSSDSRVVQQQLANVYGVKASDLRAATNLASSLKDVSKQDLTYSGMLGQLNKMANSMVLRTSTGEMLTNVWDNVQYTMATQMANDPILYLLPRVATLLEDYAGGIDLPFLNVMGFGVDLNTSVAQLMNVAAIGGSILGALGPMISGLASAASGSVMLNMAGINTSGKAPVIARGSATPLQHLGGSSISESGFIGNASGDDIKKQTLQGAEDDKKKQMVEAKDEEASADVATDANYAVINIYNLLEEVAHGSQSLRVRLVGFGSGAGSGAAGGGGSNSSNTVIGDNSGAGSTGAIGGSSIGNGAAGGAADNGNWVLTF